MDMDPDYDAEFDLAESLLQAGEATSYHPYQLIRLLEARGVTRGAPLLAEIVNDPKRGRTAALEQVRLRPSTSMGFPAEGVESVVRSPPEKDGTTRYIVTLTFGGLYGALSPLPLWIARRVLLSEKRLPAARAFFDLLHHRLLSVRYRAWRQHRYEFNFEPGGRDWLSRLLMGLVGLAPDHSEETVGATPLWMLHNLGLLLLKTRPAAGLATLLTEKLRATWPESRLLRATVVQLPPPRWLRIPDNQIARTGTARSGRTALLGRSLRDRGHYILIRIGPLQYAQAQQLAPGSVLHHRMVALCRFYLRQPLDLCFRLELSGDGIPSPRLGRPPATAQQTDRQALRLGVGLPPFLGRPPRTADPHDEGPAAPVTFTFPLISA